MTSGAKADGRFGKQDFAYLPEQDAYRCPSGALLPYHYSNVERGMPLRRYWSTAACLACPMKAPVHALQGAPDHPLGARAHYQFSIASTPTQTPCAPGASQKETCTRPPETRFDTTKTQSGRSALRGVRRARISAAEVLCIALVARADVSTRSLVAGQRTGE
jgi:hypothetical protein